MIWQCSDTNQAAWACGPGTASNPQVAATCSWLDDNVDTNRLGDAHQLQSGQAASPAWLGQGTSTVVSPPTPTHPTCMSTTAGACGCARALRSSLSITRTLLLLATTSSKPSFSVKSTKRRSTCAHAAAARHCCWLLCKSWGLSRSMALWCSLADGRWHAGHAGMQHGSYSDALACAAKI